MAFRLSREERDLIDAQAQSAGLTTSDFARRAVVGAAWTDADAMADSREQGRAEIRQELATVRARLAQAERAAVAWQAEAERLQAKLTQSSAELITAVTAVLKGQTASKVAVAVIWSRIWFAERRTLLPIVAAVVSHEFDASVLVLPFKMARDEGLVYLGRVEWLRDALDPDAGRYRSGRERSDEGSPLEQVIMRIKDEVLLCDAVLERRATRAVTDIAG